MYHPLYKIKCPPLNKLNDLAKLTLEFSLTKTLIQPEDQIYQGFVQHFTDNGYPKAGDWLWKKDILIRQHVLALIARPIGEKQEIFNVYLQNQELDERFKDGNFIPIPKPPITDIAYESAAEIAKNFYKILGEGVPADRINESEQLDRQTVLRAFTNAQLPLNVCPGCDSHPPSIADGKIREDLDHFFPKSRYPFLSIHPLNLTPFCKDCNQSYKSSRDAILDEDDMVVDVHSLNEIYHPYQRPAKDDLAIDIQTDTNGIPAFHFGCLIDDPLHQARLHSLQYLLNIEARWTGDLNAQRTDKHLQSLLFSHFLFATQNHQKQSPFVPDENWFEQQIEIAIQTFEFQQGLVPNYVPALLFAKWIRQDVNARKIWLDRVQKIFSR